VHPEVAIPFLEGEDQGYKPRPFILKSYYLFKRMATLKMTKM